MQSYIELSKEQLDALQEVGNIGIGNAASALADLINSKIEISIPKLGVVPLQDAFDMIGGPEDLVVGIQLGMNGDTKGVILFLFSVESALTLTNKLLCASFDASQRRQEFDEMSQSAIMEIGNILSGAFVNALGQMTNQRILTTPPAFACDMLGAVVSSALVASGQVDDHVFIFETQFSEEEAIKGHFLLLPEPEALDKILIDLGFQL